MSDERLAILKMVEAGQVSAEQAEALLDTIEPSVDIVVAKYEGARSPA